MHNYSNILFDLDGTLLKTDSGVLNCVRKTFNDLGFELPPEGKLRSFMGPPLEDCFTKVCGLSWEQTAKAISAFRSYYEDGGLYDAKVYDGMEDFLKLLKDKGCSLAVATSKNEKFAKMVLKHFGIYDYFDTLAGAPGNIEIKWTKRDSVLKAMKALTRADSKNTVLIGDRKFDAYGAKEAGIDSIGVLYGYGTREEIMSCPFAGIAEDIDDLKNLLL